MYLIKDLSKADEPDIQKVHNASILATYPRFLSKNQSKDLNDFLKKNGFTIHTTLSHVIGGFQNDQLCGFATVEGNRLSDLFIAPQHFGKGLGTQLLKEAIKRIGNKGWLLCRAGNKEAQAFYRKNGLEDCGLNPDDTRGSMPINMPNHVFRWGVWND